MAVATARGLRVPAVPEELPRSPPSCCCGACAPAPDATYTAFREVGKLIRTIQLLRHLSDSPLRARVTAATNKGEAFTSLLANLVIFHNTLNIADVVREL
ncbi:Tn3 family transposase [Streptomyces brevispora]|uniref:Tn3 family transposase n=1 Tax=Streptomyces brevispora TaxID=887462 RepID=UPI0037231F7A